MAKILTRHPHVEGRRVALPDDLISEQFAKRLYTVDRGVRYALPIDHIKRKEDWRHHNGLWRHDDVHGTYRAGVKFQPYRTHWQKKTLAWLRDHVHENIPYIYYTRLLGHDLHVSIFAELYGQNWHSGWADPFTGKVSPAFDPEFDTFFRTHYVDHVCDLPVCPRNAGITLEMLQGLGGFSENLGLLSGGKVTDAFISETIDELVSATASEYADFDSHEVGTSSQVENNNDTALITTSGIARAAGTPTDSDPIYQNVGTITADATETWEEHGLFNNTTGAALMDRSLTGGQAVNSSDQVQYTYQLTENPEA